MSLLAASTQPLGPTATAIVAGVLITGSVGAVIAYVVIEVHMRRGRRREEEPGEDGS